ncbi:MAG: peptidoglycan editing factor PgeF [Pseudomonadota bacterium]
MTLETITADALAPFKHGFFTRKGGASSGVFEGLNCGFGSTDQADIVEINRTRAVKALETDPQLLLGIHQTHSSDVLVVDRPYGRPWPKADALVTKKQGLSLSILSADCAPVLFADPQSKVIAAAHAGWRGALAGVLENTIDAMVRVGAVKEQINAVVGPTISQRAYEVGPEFLDDFLAESHDNTRFFINGEGDRYHFDLPSFALLRLREAGIGHAEWTRHCTYFDPYRFFSYRRSVHKKEADYGRLISIIGL